MSKEKHDWKADFTKRKKEPILPRFQNPALRDIPIYDPDTGRYVTLSGYRPVATDSRPLYYDEDRQGYVESEAPNYPRQAELIRVASVQEGLENSLKADMLMPDLISYTESVRFENLQNIKDRYKVKISEKIQAGDFNAIFYNLRFIGEDITTWIYSRGITHQAELASPERPKEEVLAFCKELKDIAESLAEGVPGRTEFLKYINEILVRFE